MACRTRVPDLAFRISKSDLKARPVYHHKKEPIDAHLAVVFAALAVSHHTEQATGWTTKKFVRTFRQYRDVTLTVAGQTILAEHTNTLTKIKNSDTH